MVNHVDANRANWDERADIHIEDATGFYGVQRFLDGEDALTPIDAAAIGDVAGLKVLHLQCHIGLDTLCLARRGAIVTGLDFSPAALGHARQLATRSGLEARFVQGDLYDAPELVGGGFDLVYTTWGTITWLPDVFRWGAVVASVLRPGGRLYFADCHPGFAVLEEIGGRLEPTFGFRTHSSVPLEFSETQTYTGDPRPLSNPLSFEWIHPVSDILMALIGQGMAIDRISEHEALPWRMVPMMVEGEDRMWRLPAGMPALPLSLSVEAVKSV
ncbi:MAG: class I SAM-dependent methyltransferase [Bauldia sp.]|uniref:class I SAM-dependent methyltransferase n=1 Tax=Bauldia sp. TaxID=2575872 RepID=UPI001DDE17C0|nr:class I SAM-dependent methyltransferase [Bauldia sp.]MCB1496358.1 class I SAM-dependent methyltransferase [Bauldia sp.]